MTVATEPTVDYGHVEPMTVHLDDLDFAGVVHNARYSLFVERAIVSYWARQGRHYTYGVASHPDMLAVVAEYSVKFLVPVRGTVDIGVHFWLDKLGSSSAVYGFRILSADGETVHATGHRVHVKLDPTTFESAPWTDETRALAERLVKPS